MRRLSPPDPYNEANLLGILLAGVFGQTREDCSSQSRLRQELRPSGIHRVTKPPKEPER
jgi:hypothetical protein